MPIGNGVWFSTDLFSDPPLRSDSPAARHAGRRSRTFAGAQCPEQLYQTFSMQRGAATMPHLVFVGDIVRGGGRFPSELSRWSGIRGISYKTWASVSWKSSPPSFSPSLA